MYNQNIENLKQYFGKFTYEELLDRLKCSSLLPLAKMQKTSYRLIQRALKGEELSQYQWKAIKTVLHETQRQLNRLEGKPAQKVEMKQAGDLKVNIQLKEDK